MSLSRVYRIPLLFTLLAVTTLLFTVRLAPSWAAGEACWPAGKMDIPADGPPCNAPEAVSYADIASGGPLTHIYAGVEASVQVAHQLDSSHYEFYPSGTRPGDAGTLLVVDGVLYAPNFGQHGGTATGNLGSFTPFTTVSQTAVTGSGTSADPYRVVTIVAAGATGVRLIQTDTYAIGSEAYRTDLQLSNSGAARNVILYRAADCYLGASDYGYGMVNAQVGAVACTKNPNNTPSGRILQYVPLTSGSRYLQTSYNLLWAYIATKQPFPNTCRCDESIDNAMGLSWQLSLPAGGQVQHSHLTTFSPLGALPLTLQKSADSAESAPNGANGYTITVNNPNVTPVTVSAIEDTLPQGFTYTANSTTGVTTANPAISGRKLTWTGSFVAPAGGSISLHFNVKVAATPGRYLNDVSGTAEGHAVSSALGVAPIDVKVTIVPISIGFVVNEDGYNFPNYGESNLSDYTQADMVLMFGQDDTCAAVVGPACLIKPAAIMWHAATVWQLRGGRCDGMTTSALRFYTEIDQPSQFEPGEELTYGLDKSNARRNLSYHHVLQFAPNVAAGRSYNTPNEVLQRVYQALQLQGASLVNLVIENQARTAAHSVLPYAIENAGEGKWRIKVYDSNSPNDANRHILIDTTANTYSTNLAGQMGSWTGDAVNPHISVSPLSLFLQTPQCPWCAGAGREGQAALTAATAGDVSLLITDSSGRRVGYVGAQFLNEIPGAAAQPQIGGLGVSLEPTYFLPSGNYTVQLRSRSGAATAGNALTLIGPGYGASLENTPVNSTPDTLTLADNGRTVSLQAGATKEVTLSLIGGATENERYIVRSVNVGAGRGVSLRQNPSAKQVTLSHQNADSGQYDLELRRVTTAGEAVLVHHNLSISAGDSHVVKLDTWSGERVQLCVDRGSNNTLDECRSIEHQDSAGPTYLFLPTILQIPYVPPAVPLLNGNFEQGRGVGWTEYSGHGWPIIVSQADFPEGFTLHSGTWGAWLGGEFNEVSFIEQEATVLPTEPYLSYYYWIASQDTCDHDFASVRVNGAVMAQYALCQSNNSTGWNRHAVNLAAYAGQTVHLQLRTETNGSRNSNLFIDDVAFSTAGLAQNQATQGQAAPALAEATKAAAEWGRGH